MPQPTDPLIAFTDPADPTGPVRLVYPAPNSPLDLAELAACYADAVDAATPSASATITDLLLIVPILRDTAYAPLAHT